MQSIFFDIGCNAKFIFKIKIIFLFLCKESDKNSFPAQRNFRNFLDCAIFGKLWRHEKKAVKPVNTLDCTETNILSKK